jgi:hypothetical protein
MGKKMKSDSLKSIQTHKIEAKLFMHIWVSDVLTISVINFLQHFRSFAIVDFNFLLKRYINLTNA